jgi:hypothetical protein
MTFFALAFIYIITVRDYKRLAFTVVVDLNIILFANLTLDEGL